MLSILVGININYFILPLLHVCTMLQDWSNDQIVPGGQENPNLLLKELNHPNVNTEDCIFALGSVILNIHISWSLPFIDLNLKEQLIKCEEI